MAATLLSSAAFAQAKPYRVIVLTTGGLSGTPVPLGGGATTVMVPSGRHTLGINDSGLITGGFEVIVNGNPRTHAFVWSPTTIGTGLTQLPAQTVFDLHAASFGASSEDQSFANDINRGGSCTPGQLLYDLDDDGDVDVDDVGVWATQFSGNLIRRIDPICTCTPDEGGGEGESQQAQQEMQSEGGLSLAEALAALGFADPLTFAAWSCNVDDGTASAACEQLAALMETGGSE